MQPQHLDAQRLEALAQLGRAGHSARMQQRLMLPGPGLVALIFGKRIDAGYQHAGLAARAQAHIHFVQPSRGRIHRQQVHHALREAQKEHLVIQLTAACGLLLQAARIMQKHQIQIRGVAQLLAAELAIADDAQAYCAPLCALTAHRYAQRRRQLLPGQRERALDDQLGDIGQSITDLHDRQP